MLYKQENITLVDEVRKTGRGKKSLDHLTRAGLIFLCSSFEVYVESVI